jgi:hypothetical protein
MLTPRVLGTYCFVLLLQVVQDEEVVEWSEASPLIWPI